MISYAKETDGWQEWQLDYRLGLILIMPPKEVSNLIDPLRKRYDPESFRICPAHVSLSDPLSHKMTPELKSEIQSLLRNFQPFQLQFGEIRASREHPGVAYTIRPEEPIHAVQEILHSSRAFNSREYARRNIPPHMTIAEFISIEDSLKLCAKLKGTAPQGTFTCDRLEFIVPDKDFRFHRQTTFLFGTSES